MTSLPAAARQPLALLVDPDDDTRHLYADFLRPTYEVDEADDGRQALAKALSRHPDVIVSETRLLGIDGFDLVRILRADRDTQNIPIVVITRDAREQALQRAREAGANDILVKPCLSEQLRDAIRRQLTRSYELRERSKAVGARARALLTHSDHVLAAAAGATRQALVKSHRRHETTEPPLAPPPLRCPACDKALGYTKSHIGGVSVKHSEQWDYYECASGCGTFQYRQRTRKLRKV